MKNLSREIHENALVVVLNYKKSEAALISAIQQVDEFKVFREYGYASLFEYVTTALGLSESSAYNFITVARKAFEIPEIKKEIEKGNLTVAKVRKVIPVISSENQRDWLMKAATLSKRDLEEAVAKVCPDSVKVERVKVVTEEICELRISVSKDLYEKLRRAQAVEQAQTLEETLQRLLDFHLEKRDPLKRAERLIKKVDKPVPGQVAIRHRVRARDQGTCTYVNPQGRRCGNQRHVEIHHVIPRSLGGLDTLSNLTTLCSAHHKLTHAQGP